MLSEWYKRARFEEGRSAGQSEGRALEREAWQAWWGKLEEWEKRRADAVEKGEPFTDPRPVRPA